MSPEAAGLERAALAMLRTLGAGRAALLLPQPVTANAQTGLGLTYSAGQRGGDGAGSVAGDGEWERRCLRG